MTADTAHLVAIHERLIREQARLAAATSESERAQRTVWVRQAEKELAAERAFLGMPADDALPDMSDDDLLRALGV